MTVDFYNKTVPYISTFSYFYIPLFSTYLTSMYAYQMVEGRQDGIVILYHRHVAHTRAIIYILFLLCILNITLCLSSYTTHSVYRNNTSIDGISILNIPQYNNITSIESSYTILQTLSPNDIILPQAENRDDYIRLSISSPAIINGIRVSCRLLSLDPCTESISSRNIQHNIPLSSSSTPAISSDTGRYIYTSRDIITWNMFLRPITRCAIQSITIYIYNNSIGDNDDHGGSSDGTLLLQQIFTPPTTATGALRVAYIPPVPLILKSFPLVHLANRLAPGGTPLPMDYPIPPHAYVYADTDMAPVLIGIFGFHPTATAAAYLSVFVTLTNVETGEVCQPIQGQLSLDPDNLYDTSITSYLLYLLVLIRRDIYQSCPNRLDSWSIDDTTWTYIISYNIPSPNPYNIYASEIYANNHGLSRITLSYHKLISRFRFHVHNTLTQQDTIQTLLPITTPIAGNEFTAYLTLDSQFESSPTPSNLSTELPKLLCGTYIFNAPDGQISYPAFQSDSITFKIGTIRPGLTHTSLPLQLNIPELFNLPEVGPPQYTDPLQFTHITRMGSDIPICYGSYEFPVSYSSNLSIYSDGNLFFPPTKILSYIDVSLTLPQLTSTHNINIHTVYHYINPLLLKPGKTAYSLTITFYAIYKVRNSNIEYPIEYVYPNTPDIVAKPKTMVSIMQTIPFTRSDLLSNLSSSIRNTVIHIYNIRTKVYVNEVPTDILYSPKIFQFCGAGYTGEYCSQRTECLDSYNYYNQCSNVGYIAYNESTGQCSNRCTCREGYTGVDCRQSALCYDIYNTQLSQCSHHGIVKSNPNDNKTCDSTCTCDPGWIGDKCDTPRDCQSIFDSVTNLDQCRGRGIVFAQPTGECFSKCTCASGWTGNRCENTTSCQLAQIATDAGQYCPIGLDLVKLIQIGPPQVCTPTCGCRQPGMCSDHGAVLPDPAHPYLCPDPDPTRIDHNCACDEGYYGPRCQHHIQCNIIYESLQECNGRGYVVYNKMTRQCERQCTCDEPTIWGGTTCEQPVACRDIAQKLKCGQYGIVKAKAASDNELVCDSSCTCLFGYQGTFCSNCNIRCHGGTLNSLSLCQTDLPLTPPCVCLPSSLGRFCQYAQRLTRITLHNRSLPLWFIESVRTRQITDPRMTTFLTKLTDALNILLLLNLDDNNEYTGNTLINQDTHLDYLYNQNPIDRGYISLNSINVYTTTCYEDDDDNTKDANHINNVTSNSSHTTSNNYSKASFEDDQLYNNNYSLQSDSYQRPDILNPLSFFLPVHSTKSPLPSQHQSTLSTTSALKSPASPSSQSINMTDTPTTLPHYNNNMTYNNNLNENFNTYSSMDNNNHDAFNGYNNNNMYDASHVDLSINIDDDDDDNSDDTHIHHKRKYNNPSSYQSQKRQQLHIPLETKTRPIQIYSAFAFTISQRVGTHISTINKEYTQLQRRWAYISTSTTLLRDTFNEIFASMNIPRLGRDDATKICTRYIPDGEGGGDDDTTGGDSGDDDSQGGGKNSTYIGYNQYYTICIAAVIMIFTAI